MARILANLSGLCFTFGALLAEALVSPCILLFVKAWTGQWGLDIVNISEAAKLICNFDVKQKNRVRINWPQTI
eukprot:scaffold137823_cov17-Prasinocladus_malaysianus.AAC.1